MDQFLWVILVAVILILLIVGAVRICVIVPQATTFVIERLGSYLCTWESGVHFKLPFVDRVAKRVTRKEQILDFPPQPAIKKYNVSLVPTIVFLDKEGNTIKKREGLVKSDEIIEILDGIK